MDLTAYVNHGRWLVTCPKCNSHLEVRKGQTVVICGACYPRLRAMGYKSHMSKRGVIIMRPVPDTDLRDEEKQRAEKAGEVYGVIYPADKKQIDSVLIKRNARNRNWIPTETLGDLITENVAHGLEVK